MTGEQPFHFEMTTNEFPDTGKFPDPEIQQGLEIAKALFKAVGIQPGTATVTLGSEKKSSIDREE